MSKNMFLVTNFKDVKGLKGAVDQSVTSKITVILLKDTLYCTAIASPLDLYLEFITY